MRADAQPFTPTKQQPVRAGWSQGLERGAQGRQAQPYMQQQQQPSQQQHHYHHHHQSHHHHHHHHHHHQHQQYQFPMMHPHHHHHHHHGGPAYMVDYQQQGMMNQRGFVGHQGNHPQNHAHASHLTHPNPHQFKGGKGVIANEQPQQQQQQQQQQQPALSPSAAAKESGLHKGSVGNTYVPPRNKDKQPQPPSSSQPQPLSGSTPQQRPAQQPQPQPRSYQGPARQPAQQPYHPGHQMPHPHHHHHHHHHQMPYMHQAHMHPQQMMQQMRQQPPMPQQQQPPQQPPQQPQPQSAPSMPAVPENLTDEEKKERKEAIEMFKKEGEKKREMELKKEQEEQDRRRMLAEKARQRSGKYTVPSSRKTEPEDEETRKAAEEELARRAQREKEERERLELEQREVEEKRQKRKVLEDSEEGPRAQIGSEEETERQQLTEQEAESRTAAMKAQEEREAQEEEERKRAEAESMLYDFVKVPADAVEALSWSEDEPVKLISVAPDSPAASSGVHEFLKQELVTCNGVDVKSVADINAAIKPQYPVTFKFKKLVPRPEMSVLQVQVTNLAIGEAVAEGILKHCQEPDYKVVKDIYRLIQDSTKARLSISMKTLTIIGFEGLQKNLKLGRMDNESLCYITAAAIVFLELPLEESLARIKVAIESSNTTVKVDEEVLKKELEIKSKEEQEKKEAERKKVEESERQRQKQAEASAAAMAEQREEEKETNGRAATRDEKNPEFHSRWSLFYSPEPDEKEPWTKPKEICTVKDVQTFWSMAFNCPAASLLKAKTSFALFREGIEATWEDKQNENGGQWQASIKEDLVDEAWSNAMLKCVGETFTAHHNKICGITIEHKKHAFWRLSLWLSLSDAPDQKPITLALGRDFKEQLTGLLSHGTYMKFVNNKQNTASPGGPRDGILL